MESLMMLSISRLYSRLTQDALSKIAIIISIDLCLFNPSNTLELEKMNVDQSRILNIIQSSECRLLIPLNSFWQPIRPFEALFMDSDKEHAF